MPYRLIEAILGKGLYEPMAGLGMQERNPQDTSDRLPRAKLNGGHCC